jgi:hypothetical protein
MKGKSGGYRSTPVGTDQCVPPRRPSARLIVDGIQHGTTRVEGALFARNARMHVGEASRLLCGAGLDRKRRRAMGTGPIGAMRRYVSGKADQDTPFDVTGYQKSAVHLDTCADRRPHIRADGGPSCSIFRTSGPPVSWNRTTRVMAFSC